MKTRPEKRGSARHHRLAFVAARDRGRVPKHDRCHWRRGICAPRARPVWRGRPEGRTNGWRPDPVTGAPQGPSTDAASPGLQRQRVRPAGTEGPTGRRRLRPRRKGCSGASVSGVERCGGAPRRSDAAGAGRDAVFRLPSGGGMSSTTGGRGKR